MDVRDKAGYEQTPENEAAEEAAFEAGFNATDVEPAAETNTTDADQAAADALQQQADPQAEQSAAPAAAVELKVADLLAVIEEQKTAQARLHDKVFGKMGELQQKIEAMRTTAHGISSKARERLKADFPELAEMLFEDAPEPQQIAAPTAAQIPAATAQPAEDVERKFERRLLTRDHRDWEQVVSGQDFATWKDTVLKPEDAAALDESWDADFISGKITEFKNWQAAEAKKSSDRQAKQQRLDDAIIPRGLPRAGAASPGDDDEEAAMLAAYGRK